MASDDNNNSGGSSSNAKASAVLETLVMDAADVRKNINSGRFKLSSKTDSKSNLIYVVLGSMTSVPQAKPLTNICLQE